MRAKAIAIVFAFEVFALNSGAIIRAYAAGDPQHPTSSEGLQKPKINIGNPGGPPGLTSETEAGDLLFMSWMERESHLLEKLGELGLLKSKDPELRMFSQYLYDLHETIHIATLARALSDAPAQDLPLDVKEVLRNLSILSGPAFEHRYAQVGVHSLRESVAVFDNASRMSGDPAIRNFAAEILNSLRPSLRRAELILDRLGG